MVKYAFKAVVPFSVLGSFVLLGFSFAVKVVFMYRDHEKSEIDDHIASTPVNTKTGDRSEGPPVSYCDDGVRVKSVLHVFKMLFHACIGNFDDKVRRLTSLEMADLLLICRVLQMILYTDDPSFIGTWRIFLFDAFVFVGGIVLISLLVAILSDTFDNVKYTQKAELVKCRAEMAGSALFFVARHIINFEDRFRQTSLARLPETNL